MRVRNTILRQKILVLVLFTFLVSIVRCEENHLDHHRRPRQLSSILGNLFGHGHGHSNTNNRNREPMIRNVNIPVFDSETERDLGNSMIPRT